MSHCHSIHVLVRRSPHVIPPSPRRPRARLITARARCALCPSLLRPPFPIRARMDCMYQVHLDGARGWIYHDWTTPRSASPIRYHDTPICTARQPVRPRAALPCAVALARPAHSEAARALCCSSGRPRALSQSVPQIRDLRPSSRITSGILLAQCRCPTLLCRTLAPPVHASPNCICACAVVKPAGAATSRPVPTSMPSPSQTQVDPNPALKEAVDQRLKKDRLVADAPEDPGKMEEESEKMIRDSAARLDKAYGELRDLASAKKEPALAEDEDFLEAEGILEEASL
ncbi:hypothetical protein B0H10DRAFT_2213806 [Mycena sp. CBHHK59/15]|nr:hypothetical protein B0H10DRAFT_2213806 [Mycena sp. CBHHK59/15]